MSLARMRIDELVNAWVGERYTPFQLGLLGVFDAGPWKRPGGTIDVARLRLDLAGRAGGVADLRRRALDAALQGSSLVGGRSGVRRCPHVVSTRLPHGEDLASWAANRCVRPLDLDRPLWRADVVDGLPGGAALPSSSSFTTSWSTASRECGSPGRCSTPHRMPRRARGRPRRWLRCRRIVSW